MLKMNLCLVNVKDEYILIYSSFCNVTLAEECNYCIKILLLIWSCTNKKIIGARYYGSGSRKDTTQRERPLSARDSEGHGTHTASTAAGSVVAEADYYGLAKGSARGGSPTSRIAVYRVCSRDGCRGSDILAGLDDAVKDGVNVISISLGSNSVLQPDFLSDAISIGSFHATQKGILVVCSAGNDGPSSNTLVNTAPWILTVAATTIDRDFVATPTGNPQLEHGLLKS
jgi:subtilisin family serine protease